MDTVTRQLAGEAESAGVLSCVCPEASPWGSSPAPGSELSSATGVGHGVGEGEPQRTLVGGAGLCGRSVSENKATPVVWVVPRV